MPPGRCNVEPVSVHRPSGFDAWQRRGASERAAQDVVLAARIAAIHRGNHGAYGVPRIHA